MGNGTEKPISRQVSVARDTAEAVRDRCAESLERLGHFEYVPFFDYQAEITAAYETAEEAADPLRLDRSDLEQVETAVATLRRTELAIDAQLTTHRRATESILDQYSRRISLIDEILASNDADHQNELERCAQWVETAEKFAENNTHSELVAADGSYNLNDLEARIDQVEDQLLESNDTDTVIAYHRRLCDANLDAAETALARLDRVLDATDQEYQRLDELREAIGDSTETIAIKNTLAHIRVFKSQVRGKANRAVETALFLEAMEDQDSVPDSLLDFIEATWEQLKQGKLDGAQTRVEKIVYWEDEISEADHLEIKLAECGGDLVRAVDHLPISMEDALDIIKSMYRKDKVAGLEIDLK